MHCIRNCKDVHHVQVKGGYWSRQAYVHVERGDYVYRQNRKRCRKRRKLIDGCNWLTYIKELTQTHKSSPYDIVHKVDDLVFDVQTNKFLNVTYRQKYHLDDTSVSERSIYNAFHSKDINTIKPYMMLMQYKKGKKYVFKEGKRINGECITSMRKELLERDMHSVWEADTVVGKLGSKQCLFTLTNRRNNDEVIIKLADRTKLAVVNALNQVEQTLGYERFHDIFSYIIFDNGVEFRDVDGIENSCLLANTKRTKIYFARPYRSTDRAINENNNRMIRKWIPKSSDINGFSNKSIQTINLLINLTHRRRLNGLCANPNGNIIIMSS